MLLGLLFVSSSLVAMETGFSIDPTGIVPHAKYCFLCQNNAPRLGIIDVPVSFMLADGQRFDYKAHPACHKKIVTPLLTAIEKNYPVGKVQKKHMQLFLWALYVDAYSGGKSMHEAYPKEDLLMQDFKAYLDGQKL